MKTRIPKLVVVALPFLLAGLVAELEFGGESPPKDPPAVTTLGNVQQLRSAYDRWKVKATQNGGDRTLVLPLKYTKGLSAQFSKAHGRTTLDLIDGSVSVEVSGFSDKEAFDVWLIDNRPGPGHSVRPEPGDAMIRVGTLKRQGNTATLQTRLGREALAGFKLDLVVVARAGKDPGAAGLLFGSPSLFQRLYHGEQRGQFARLGGADARHSPESRPRSLLSAPFRALIPSPAHADETEDLTAVLEALVADGEDLFFNEAFEGNGRTCGTCHPANNNLTIDPAFIATLPPNDPLFVAEFNPALAQLEKPQLMRQFGLILENVDGLDDPTNKFVMRGVPHTLALITSIEKAQNIPGGPAEMTGWSGDGSPGGTLRDFATGAVTQHFTKTLSRDPDADPPDFRLPTDDELNAMEAFQLSLGRQEDLNLPLNLNDLSASLGQNIFINGTGDGNLTPGGKCQTCHFNAGANAAAAVDQNRNFDTGVENRPDSPTLLAGVPRDGGFGTAGTLASGFGDGKFNSTPLVEAADSGPFFHNNAVSTIEEAIEHYNSAAFNNPRAPVARIQLDATQVTAVGAFLRVINALENIRSAMDSNNRAISTLNVNPGANVDGLLKFARHEIEDAKKVLTGGGGLHPGAIAQLGAARGLITAAIQNPVGHRKIDFIEQANRRLDAARGDIVV